MYLDTSSLPDLLPILPVSNNFPPLNPSNASTTFSSRRIECATYDSVAFRYLVHGSAAGKPEGPEGHASHMLC